MIRFLVSAFSVYRPPLIPLTTISYSLVYPLDLSAVFDTTDHNILLTCLSSWYGIYGTALYWSRSYLSSGCFRVKCNNDFSSSHTCLCGVPQGSVLSYVQMVEYQTRNQEVAGSTHTRSTASNIEQVANQLCAPANSASYPQRDGKWVVATATGWRPRPLTFWPWNWCASFI